MKARLKEFGRLMLVFTVAAFALAACNKGRKKEEAAAVPAGSGQVVAVVDGEEVYADEFLASARRLPPITRTGLLQPEKRREFLDEFLEEKLLYIEAKRRGLDKDPETAQRIRDYAERVTIQALRRDLQRDPVDDAAVEKYYGDHTDEFTQERSRYSMILKRRPPSRTPEDDKRIEKEIDGIYSKLKGGADFAKVAAAESEEPRSKAQGGDLGYVGLDRWGSVVAAEGEKLKVGEVSKPFQVGYGWVILKRTSEPKVITAPLAEVKPRIAQKLRIERLDAFKKDLHAKAEIKVEEDVLDSLDFGAGPGAAGGMRRKTEAAPSEQEAAQSSDDAAGAADEGER